MEGMGRILQFNFFKPRIFSRRLIKMAMDTNKFMHKKLL
jgi:hypothetical protein